MKATAILSSNLLDIIFENRNKAYGAYELRRDYNRRLLISMLGMALLVCLASYFIISPERKNGVGSDDLKKGNILEMPPAETPKPKPKEQVKLKVATSVATVNINKPLIVQDHKADSTIPDIDMADKALPGDRTKPGDAPDPGDVPGKDPGDGGDKPAKPEEPAKPVVDKNIPIANPDIQPEYPGGMNAFIKFLERNLRAPEPVDEGSEIAVRVKFIVNYDGTLKGFDVIKSGGDAFDQEVLRVLKKMPKWIPGKTSGEDVSVFYTVPVKFRSSE